MTSWYPSHRDFPAALKKIKAESDSAKKFASLKAASRHNLDFLQVASLDRQLQELSATPERAGVSPLKLALLGSFTIEHLLPSIRVAALRRGLLVQTFSAPYNQYRQELLNPSSLFHSFGADVVLFAFHLNDVGLSFSFGVSEAEVAEAIQKKADEWTAYWELARQKGAAVIHQTVPAAPETFFGHFDTHVAGSPKNVINELNRIVRLRSKEKKVILFDAEELAGVLGKKEWFNRPMWFHAKQAVPQHLATHYGDHVARLLGALRGVSAKCLVLDLDNTVWGGVIGDDGVEGIILGQGNAVGEAYQDFQNYVSRLRERGVILAVCSKNEEANARIPFESHDEMVLKLDDIAVFTANWNDKVANLKSIASQLNIGLDSLVFFDDNPAERALVRQLAPEIHVPEVPEDPALYAACLSDGGYFEAISFTADDALRSEQYKANAKRQELQSNSADLETFLKNLDMQMEAGPFDAAGRSRIAQLINKSNQFNLTTRRYSEEQVGQLEKDPSALTLQVRLKDTLGDNGMISVVIGLPGENKGELLIDTWLMSCRVLGRQTEDQVLNVLAVVAKERGFRFLIGDYIPTAKNKLVADHFPKFNFQQIQSPYAIQGATRWKLDLDAFKPIRTHIACTVRSSRDVNLVSS